MTKVFVRPFSKSISTPGFLRLGIFQSIHRKRRVKIFVLLIRRVRPATAVSLLVLKDDFSRFRYILSSEFTASREKESDVALGSRIMARAKIQVSLDSCLAIVFQDPFHFPITGMLSIFNNHFWSFVRSLLNF